MNILCAVTVNIDYVHHDLELFHICYSLNHKLTGISNVCHQHHFMTIWITMFIEYKLNTRITNHPCHVLIPSVKQVSSKLFKHCRSNVPRRSHKSDVCLDPRGTWFFFLVISCLLLSHIFGWRRHLTNCYLRDQYDWFCSCSHLEFNMQQEKCEGKCMKSGK